MSINGDPTTPSPPAPMIGKIGPYTVFVTPPQTPKPSSLHSPQHSPLSSNKSQSPPPRKFDSPIQSPPPPKTKLDSPPPVLPPPMHYDTKSDSSSFAFFWNAVAKVQHAHSNLDGFVAHWFGLNQSKYQWALDDYYETKGMVEEMPLYDCMLLLKPHVSRPDVMDLVSRVGRHIYRKNGVLTELKSFGSMQLGYGIKKLDGRHYQGQMLQMTMMAPPSINKELHYLNKEDRLLRWLLVKHRDVKFGFDYLDEDDGKGELSKFRSKLFDDEDKDMDFNDDEDDDDDDDEYDADQEEK